MAQRLQTRTRAARLAHPRLRAHAGSPLLQLGALRLLLAKVVLALVVRVVVPGTEKERKGESHESAIKSKGLKVRAPCEKWESRCGESRWSAAGAGAHVACLRLVLGRNTLVARRRLKLEVLHGGCAEVATGGASCAGGADQRIRAPGAEDHSKPLQRLLTRNIARAAGVASLAADG